MSAKTFGQHADDHANNASDQPWFEAREARLSELLTAFWLGEFEDQNGGDTQLSITIANNAQSSPDPATRRLVLRALPIGALWMPEEIRRSSQEPPPYHALAAMRARQYDPVYLFNLLERISIPDDTYRPWLRSRQIAPQAQDQPSQSSEQKTKQQTARKLDTNKRNDNLQVAATKIWKECWNTNQRVLKKEDVAQKLLKHPNANDLCRSTRASDGDKLTRDSIVRRIRMPAQFLKRRQKAIQHT